MAECAPYVSRLLALTEDFRIRLDGKKREKNLMDFHDMEHMALQILTRKTPEGCSPPPQRWKCGNFMQNHDR